jgi:hypothetical protein
VTTPANRITTIALDVVAPLTVFYGLRACGVDDVPALVASAVPPSVNIAAIAVRRRRVDALAVAVLAGTALGVAAALLGGGPRELLSRGAWFSAPAGLWTLATLLRRQPLCYEVTRALLPGRAPLMDRLWETDETFRAAWRAITVCWGLATLTDSALRVVVAYTLPVATVPAVDTAITVVTMIVLQVPTHLVLRRSGHWHALFARARSPVADGVRRLSRLDTDGPREPPGGVRCVPDLASSQSVDTRADVSGREPVVPEPVHAASSTGTPP